MDLVFQRLVYVRILNWVEYRSTQLLDAAVHDWPSQTACRGLSGSCWIQFKIAQQVPATAAQLCLQAIMHHILHHPSVWFCSAAALADLGPICCRLWAG
jgi:hypothetical protein